MDSGIVSAVLQTLNSAVQKELGLLWGVEKQRKDLSRTLSMIQKVLEDAERKQLQDEAIKEWLRNLKAAAYELDDILDECSTKALRRKSLGQTSGSLEKVSSSLFYPVENFLFSHKIGTRMKEMVERLDKIDGERKSYTLNEIEPVEKRVRFDECRERGFNLAQPVLCGRVAEKANIVKVLVENLCDREEVSVYPIVGIGGLGKTTLAQMIFNDERVKGHFEPKIWVHVSQDFDVERVLKDTISRPGKACEASDLGSLQESLRDVLSGKRYLIVLDDLWSDNQDKWDQLKYPLASGSKGASVIITTRGENVASITATIPPHHLSFLSPDDCWMLFKQRAFGCGNEERPNLVAIGKEIVKKCGGVPLAAKALGGLLRDKDESYCLFVKGSEIWNLPQDENPILHILRLSYYNLPVELRCCFAYCAIFPKGSIIEKDHLVRLWMANGYIPFKGKQEQEDIGGSIFNELCWSSLFQVLYKDEIDGNKWTGIFHPKMDEEMCEIGCFTLFKMHDLVCDLAQSVMEDQCQIMKTESSSIVSNKNVRHVSLGMLEGEDQATCFPLRRDKLDLKKFVSSRVVDAKGWKITKLPSSIGNLKHLRYLDLSGTDVKQLPNSICSMWNLQTLVLEDCGRLERLPNNMNYLTNLRHLYLPKNTLIGMPPKIGQLTCLKTLSVFVVGKSRNCSSLAELKYLNLGGKLRIEVLDRVRNPMDAKDANLVGKKNLWSLELSWRGAGTGVQEFQSHVDAEKLLEALEPHPILKRLLIENYNGIHFPRGMRNLVHGNIAIIKLRNLKKCSQLPPFGQLPLLRRLEIDGMDEVEFVDNYYPGGGPVRGFPSLEVITFISMPNLKGLSREDGRELFPRLCKIMVTDCPKLSFPGLSSSKELVIQSMCTNVVLNSISNLTGLTSLRVAQNTEATCFPAEVLGNLTLLESIEVIGFEKLKVLPRDLANLVKLKSLHIYRCPELESLPADGLRGLESLHEIYIQDCNKLSSLSEGLQHLTALETLRIGRCPELVALPEGIKHLSSLRRLWMWEGDNNAKLVALPEALQYVPALQSLEIYFYSELKSLPDWLGNLTSLRRLVIWESPKITSLPASIQSLTRLQTFYILAGSRELERRCEKGGKDWNKIAHIPHVHVS